MTTQRIALNLTLVGVEWIARVASIISIGLLLALFIGESGLDPSHVAAREAIGLVFFPVGVVIGMIVAWWKEGWGGAISVLSLVGFYFVYGYLLSSHIHGWYFVMFTAPGFLFLLHWFLLHVDKRPKTYR